ncbi:MAG: AAA domain-containing protein, partial [Planctomycetota bacterium]
MNADAGDFLGPDDEPAIGLTLSLAAFDEDLRLPGADKSVLMDVAAAMEREIRSAGRRKKLHCVKVDVFAERDRGTVFVLHVRGDLQFDWTIEGARAFQFGNRDALPADAGRRPVDDEGHEPSTVHTNADYRWSGDVVGVDEMGGCLFLSIDRQDMIPTAGEFVVEPFEFLATLNAIYNEERFSEIRCLLPPRLNAALGGVHPRIDGGNAEGMAHLHLWWRHSWCVLWGPPGTGKTWTIGQQIAHLMNDTDERVLVVSTTNQATDKAAFSLGNAAKQHCPECLHSGTLARLGNGASQKAFESRQLDMMLVDSNQRVSALTEALREQIRNTNAPEQQALLQIELQRVRANAKSDRSRFLDPDLRVVCTTMFNAVRMLDQFHVRQVIESGQAPFTTIFIDEAGMVSRAALAALSLLAAHRVVLVGDGRQLSPISVTSGLLPSNQQVWLGCSGLADLNQTDDLPDAIHLLTQQRRMHPAICNVVSRYQYNGTLTTASERVQTKQQIPDSIAAHGPAMWYVLDAESCNLAMIRASRDRNGGSWIRERSFDIVRRLLGDDEIAKSNGL